MAYFCENLARLLGEAKKRGLPLPLLTDYMRGNNIPIAPSDLNAIRNNPKKTVHSATRDDWLACTEYLLAHWGFSQEKLLQLLQSLYNNPQVDFEKVGRALCRNTQHSSSFMQLIRGERKAHIHTLSRYHLENLLMVCQEYDIDAPFLLPPKDWTDLPRKHAQEMADFFTAIKLLSIGEKVQLATLCKPLKDGKIPQGIHTFKHPTHGYTTVVIQEGVRLSEELRRDLVIWDKSYKTEGLAAA